jgi:O-antigen/teichoic acid export membrane protein
LKRVIRSLQGLLYETPLPTQVLHSGTSFLLMAGMARLAPPEAFGLAAAFFLLVTLSSSLSIYVLSAAWLRLVGDDAKRRLEGFTLSLTASMGLVFAPLWLAYRGWAFGVPEWREVGLAAIASFAYQYFFARRRQLLLDGYYQTALAADGLRSLSVMTGAAVMIWRGGQLDFSDYLVVFACAHLLGVLPVLSVREGRVASTRVPPPLADQLRRTLSPLRTITRGDWLTVGSGLANLLFSQAATLLAPILIGSTQYAVLRAYELFLFPVFFVVQVLDPLYMRKFREELTDTRHKPEPLQQLAAPALLIFAPLTLIALGAWLSPWVTRLVQALIAPEYRDPFWMLALVVMLSALISLNSPARWYLTVLGRGESLLMGTAVGVVLSLLVLVGLSQWQAMAWTVLVAKMVYELCLVIAGYAGLAGYGRRR